MVFVDKTLEEMTQEVGCARLAFSKSLTPKDNPDLFKSRHCGYKKYFNAQDTLIVSLLNEMELGEHSEYVVGSVISLAIENSLTRGHLGDLFLPLTFNVLVGSEGSILRIRDYGLGFNHVEHLELRTRGKRCYDGNGEGIKYFNSASPEIAYEGSGNIMNIMVKK
jgi:hypothetical protein